MKNKFFQDKTALPKGYHYLKKITLGSEKNVFCKNSLLRIHHTAFENVLYTSLPNGTIMQNLLNLKISF